MNTMGQILSNWRVLSATFVAVLLVLSAYFLAKNTENPPIAQASTETELLQAIATRDSDGDGLPDWQEALYGTDPHKTDTYNLGMTDGEAVAKGLIVPKAVADIPVATSSPSQVADENGLPPPPAQGTLTAAFAQNFFTLYLQAKQASGGTLTQNQISNVANQAISSLSQSVTAAPDFKSASDIHVSGSGPDALKEYAANAEQVLMTNKAKATSTPLMYLKYALNGDNRAIAALSSMSKAYRDGAVGLAALSVPQETAVAHLELVNAFMRMSRIVNDFTKIDTDPLASIFGLQQYLTAVQNLGQAFSDVDGAYATAGVALAPGTPGASLVNIVADIKASQASAETP